MDDGSGPPPDSPTHLDENYGPFSETSDHHHESEDESGRSPRDSLVSRTATEVPSPDYAHEKSSEFFDDSNWASAFDTNDDVDSVWGLDASRSQVSTQCIVSFRFGIAFHSLPSFYRYNIEIFRMEIILVKTQEEQILQLQEALLVRERVHLDLMTQFPALHSRDSGTLLLGSATHQPEITTLIASPDSTPSTIVKLASPPSPRDCHGLIPSTAPKTLGELPSPGLTQSTVPETLVEELRNFRGLIPSTVAETLVVLHFQDSTQ